MIGMTYDEDELAEEPTLIGILLTPDECSSALYFLAGALRRSATPEITHAFRSAILYAIERRGS